jgi:hypothetical protein
MARLRSDEGNSIGPIAHLELFPRLTHACGSSARGGLLEVTFAAYSAGRGGVKK